jgi:uncharacterized protein
MNSATDLAAKLGLRTSDLEEITRVLSNYPDISEARIYGSRAKGTYRNGSDVDLALFGDDLNDKVVRTVRYILNEETRMPYRFDVVDATHLSHAGLKEQIEKAGVVVYNL